MIYFWVIFAIIGFAGILLICAQVWYYWVNREMMPVEKPQPLLWRVDFSLYL